ncbi:hypothetical protein TCAL_17135 [Tigriopus californicus]|uniref:Uncharacterized protein n=1 Tax=Tigriopus californicus TaxID=6832 RepID=A0A553P4M9_TIGCA|nr:hypothetical protein TCAL_17135 [Tigriopus californicus]
MDKHSLKENQSRGLLKIVSTLVVLGEIKMDEWSDSRSLMEVHEITHSTGKMRAGFLMKVPFTYVSLTFG